MAVEKYRYAKVPITGFKWHLEYNVFLTIGRYPASQSHTSSGTYLGFDPPLDAGEVALIDALMTGDPMAPGHVDFQGSQFVVEGVEDHLEEFKAAIGGLDFDIYFSKSSPDKPYPDQVEFHFSKLLTAQDKTAIETAYEALGSWRIP